MRGSQHHADEREIPRHENNREAAMKYFSLRESGDQRQRQPRQHSRGIQQSLLAKTRIRRRKSAQKSRLLPIPTARSNSRRSRIGKYKSEEKEEFRRVFDIARYAQAHAQSGRDRANDQREQKFRNPKPDRGARL